MLIFTNVSLSPSKATHANGLISISTFTEISNFLRWMKFKGVLMLQSNGAEETYPSDPLIQFWRFFFEEDSLTKTAEIPKYY